MSTDLENAFHKEPVTFLLSNALRHLTLDQQRQLCNALLERLPVPASAVEEAARMYPEPVGRIKERPYTEHEIVDIQRDVHIRCAGMYQGEIEKLRAELDELKTKMYGQKHNL